MQENNIQGSNDANLISKLAVRAEAYVSAVFGDALKLTPTAKPDIILAPSTAGKTTVIEADVLGDFTSSQRVIFNDNTIANYLEDSSGKRVHFVDIDTFMKAIIYLTSMDAEVGTELSKFASQYTLKGFYQQSNDEFAKMIRSLKFGDWSEHSMMLWILSCAVAQLRNTASFLMATRENVNLVTTSSDKGNWGRIIVMTMEPEVMHERAIARDGSDLPLSHFESYAGTIANYIVWADEFYHMNKEDYLSDMLIQYLL